MKTPLDRIFLSLNNINRYWVGLKILANELFKLFDFFTFSTNICLSFLYNLLKINDIYYYILKAILLQKC